MQTLEKIVVVGGGTAGWMAAAALAKTLESRCHVTLVESDEIGTIGVGEATIPPIIHFLKYLGISEQAFMRATNATYKLAIEFKDWFRLGDSFFHPFGAIGAKIDGSDFYPYWHKAKKEGTDGTLCDYSVTAAMCLNKKFAHPANAARNSAVAAAGYALHFDAGKVAEYLRRYAEKLGALRKEGKVVDCRRDDRGFITSVLLESGDEIAGDFFIDCSGFKALLISGAMQSPYESWKDLLFCDSAIAMQSQMDSKSIPVHTVSQAETAGWTWRIPLQNRIGNGIVFSRAHLSEEQAYERLLERLPGEKLTEPNVLRFTPGRRKKAWVNNCLALGLSAGFLEPLESTAIHLITRGLRALLDFFPDKNCSPALADEYNRIMSNDFEEIRDFLILHYVTSSRTDSQFWQDVQRLNVPASLEEKINLYRSSGYLKYEPGALFKAPSWHCLFEGMQVFPEAWDPKILQSDNERVEAILLQLKSVIGKSVEGMPTHLEFLKRNCWHDQ